VCQLNSRTAILSAANPVHSRYDSKKSVVENINLPPSLLSRFDLIYIMLDIPSEVNDARLATHILDFYSQTTTQKPSTGPLSSRELARYITYARQEVRPRISQ
jgi:DNA replication licensing factor MCM4